MTFQERMLAPVGSMHSFVPTIMTSTRLPSSVRQRIEWRIWPFSRINVPPTQVAMTSSNTPHSTDAIAPDLSK